LQMLRNIKVQNLGRAWVFENEEHDRDKMNFLRQKMDLINP